MIKRGVSLRIQSVMMVADVTVGIPKSNQRMLGPILTGVLKEVVPMVPPLCVSAPGK